MRSSRWIATISARARRLSRPKSCWADLGMVRTSRMLRGVASCAQFSLHGAPSHTSVGSQKRDAATTFWLARGRVEACCAAPDSSEVAAPARVRSVALRITACSSSSGSTHGRVSDISCCNAKFFATFLSTYRHGAVDADRGRQARGASSVKTLRNRACSRAS